MDEKKSYQKLFEDKLNDLPLPDVEGSWNKMRMLLDEDKKKRRILPMLITRGCAGLLLFALLIGVWFGIEKTGNERLVSSEKQRKMEGEKAATKKQSNQTKEKSKDLIHSNKQQTEEGRSVVKSKENDSARAEGKNENTRFVIEKNKKEVQQRAKKVERIYKQRTGRNKLSFKDEQLVSKTQRKDYSKTANDSQAFLNRNYIHKSEAIDSYHIPIDTQLTKGLFKRSIDFSIHISDKEIVSATQLNVGLSAGAGLVQQIPAFGQKLTPYNREGRKASFADYLPFLYLRYSWSNWFVQGELRYGAPQYTKEIMYSASRLDSSGISVTRQYLTLKKSFYHHINLSANRMVTPKLSLGTGVLYSRFYGAVSEREIRRQSLNAPTEVVLGKELIKVPASTDSFFVRSQLHLLLQGQYAAKRFAIGARYMQSLQPYLKYTTATGTFAKEKNKNLSVFITYRLWKQKSQ